jgi:plastocyanin
VVAAVPAVDAAAPDTASITAKDFSWDNGSGESTVTIAMGGTVSFGYPSGSSFHNVDFSSATPTSCTQTAGTNVGPVPPLPAVPSGAGWAGTCRFDSPGTYAFVCDAHASMTGTVEVVDPNAPTTGTTAPPGGPGPGEPGGGGPAGGELAAPAVKVPSRQRGTVVHGSVTTPGGPSRIAVTAFASRRALAARARKLRIGSVTKRSAGTGPTRFALTVNRAARRALHRRHRLAVGLRIVVTPSAGSAVARMVAVTLREKR